MITFTRKKWRLQSRFYLRILAIMGLCGAGFLSSCTKYGAPEPEYGVPAYDIKFFGTIKSQDSLKNIPGLTVRLIDKFGWGDSIQTITNATGQYALYRYAYKGDQFTLKVLDKDSTINAGWFRDTTINLEISGRDINNLEHKADVILEKK